MVRRAFVQRSLVEVWLPDGDSVLVAGDLRLAPERDVIGRGRRRPEHRLLDGPGRSRGRPDARPALVSKCSRGARSVRLCRRRP
jgi:hypothetical protein